ncbi:hypothetical protein BHM03_00025652 [Ensete ventricosum]|nr:hypothetical protein BHM03_00025652 [Ensete ventricosum]
MLQLIYCHPFLAPDRYEGLYKNEQVSRNKKKEEAVKSEVAVVTQMFILLCPSTNITICSSKETLVTWEGDLMLDYCSKEDWRRWVGKLHFPGEGLPPILSLPRMVPLHAPRRRSYPRLSDWVRTGELRSPWDKLLQDCKKKERKKEQSTSEENIFLIHYIIPIS